MRNRENSLSSLLCGEAFRANFNIYDIPEILATPCCSQIAVTKERLRSLLRGRYGKAVELLVRTELDDGISGRTWEQYG
jgi:hypothetical protein